METRTCCAPSHSITLTRRSGGHTVTTKTISGITHVSCEVCDYHETDEPHMSVLQMIERHIANPIPVLA